MSLTNLRERLRNAIERWPHVTFFFGVALVALLLVLTKSVFIKPEAFITRINEQNVPEEPFRVIGYVQEGSMAPEDIPFDQVTHLNYAFAVPQSDSSLVPLNRPDEFAQIVELAHANNVKVLISIGGWGHSQAFAAFSKTQLGRERFVESVLGIVGRYKLDGVDIDWEYPASPEDSAAFAQLMQSLHAELHDRGKLLTAAVSYQGNAEYVPEEIFDNVDFLNIMAYDGQGASHTSMEEATNALDYWRDRGLPQEKTILGLAFYSRPTVVSFKNLLAYNALAYSGDSLQYGKHTVHYNGAETIKAKTALAKSVGSGVMVWTLDYDAAGEHSLLKAIQDQIHKSP